MKTVVEVTEVWEVQQGLGKVFGCTMTDETWCWQVKGNAQWRKYLKQFTNNYCQSNWNHPIEKEVIVDSSMKPSVQSAVTVAETNAQIYKNGIENDWYHAVEIHGPVLSEILFGCDHLYARKYSQRVFLKWARRWGGNWRKERICGECM